MKSKSVVTVSEVFVLTEARKISGPFSFNIVAVTTKYMKVDWVT